MSSKEKRGMKRRLEKKIAENKRRIDERRRKDAEFNKMWSEMSVIQRRCQRQHGENRNVQ